MSSGLEDLTKNVFGDAGVEATHVKGPLVGLGSGTTGEGATARGRDDPTLVATAQRRCDRSWDGVGVLRDMEGRRGHVRRVAIALAVLVAGRAGVGLGRRGELAGGRSGTVVSHFVCLFAGG